VENWDIHALQTEGEAGESIEAVSLEINASKHITIANYHGYRVIRSRAPFPAAVRICNSESVRFRNVHVNAESGIGFCNQDGCYTFLRLSKFPFENSIQDADRDVDGGRHRPKEEAVCITRRQHLPPRLARLDEAS
jgi:hypothetical protein